jgi:thiol:disulfide interchange protein DsbD
VIAERGYFVAFLVVFLWGLALNLTPCVYPIIPITVGYFGGQSAGRTSRTLLLASMYVLGMAVMYSLLGLFAALTGSLLGTALQNPLVIIFVAVVLAALAFSMFGYYEIRVPMQLTGLAGKSSARGGVVGAFLTGLTVGIVAAPCIGPFVLALLTYVGETASPLLGFTLFFTLAIGLGLPFMFLALVSGSISRLPRSGEWMEWVKKLFGLILLVMAVFFLAPLLAPWLYFLVQGALLLVGGIWLGFAARVRSSSPLFRLFKRFVGIAVPLLGIYLVAAPGHIFGGKATKAGIVWTAYNQDLRTAAIGRPVIIDFAAEWCIPCKELDIRTFTDPDVIAAVADVVTLKADLTHTGSPEVTALRDRYDIRGVPTIVFLDLEGRERADLRVLGFVDAADFLSRVMNLKE